MLVGIDHEHRHTIGYTTQAMGVDVQAGTVNEAWIQCGSTHQHDFDFASLGLLGLTLMNRYIQGRDIDVSPADHNGKELIRESELAYSVQTGTFKDLVL